MKEKVIWERGTRLCPQSMCVLLCVVCRVGFRKQPDGRVGHCFGVSTPTPSGMSPAAAGGVTVRVTVRVRVLLRGATDQSTQGPRVV